MHHLQYLECASTNTKAIDHLNRPAKLIRIHFQDCSETFHCSKGTFDDSLITVAQLEHALAKFSISVSNASHQKCPRASAFIRYDDGTTAVR